jgi:hypothetical protein
MKNSSNAIGNRSRDLPVCSAVPQPLRHRVLQLTLGYSQIEAVLNSFSVSHFFFPEFVISGVATFFL